MFEFKKGDKVKIRGLGLIRSVELIPNGEPYPLRVDNIRFTKYGEFKKGTGDVLLTLIERPNSISISKKGVKLNYQFNQK